MLRAKDLMIGDWVKIKGGGCFQMEDVSGAGMFKRWTSDGEYMIPYAYDEIEPIPLTPEILEKNGFVNDNSVYGVRYRWESEDTRTEIRIYSPQDGYSGMTIIKNSYLVDEVSYDLPDVYTVHELQHALRLCGINLEIKL